MSTFSTISDRELFQGRYFETTCKTSCKCTQ